jgi:hypothetical protein
MEKGKAILLKEVPKDVYDILLDEQTRVRKEGNKVFSLASTIYKIIRTHNKCQPENTPATAKK